MHDLNVFLHFACNVIGVQTYKIEHVTMTCCFLQPPVTCTVQPKTFACSILFRVPEHQSDICVGLFLSFGISTKGHFFLGRLYST